MIEATSATNRVFNMVSPPSMLIKTQKYNDDFYIIPSVSFETYALPIIMGYVNHWTLFIMFINSFIGKYFKKWRNIYGKNI